MTAQSTSFNLALQYQRIRTQLTILQEMWHCATKIGQSHLYWPSGSVTTYSYLTRPSGNDAEKCF